MRCQCGQCRWPDDAFQLCLSQEGSRYAYVRLGVDESILMMGACGRPARAAARAECLLFPRFDKGGRWLYYVAEGTETGIRRVDTGTLAVDVVTRERDWCPIPVGEGGVAFFRVRARQVLGMVLASGETRVLTERGGEYLLTGYERGYVSYVRVVDSAEGLELVEGRCGWAW